MFFVRFDFLDCFVWYMGLVFCQEVQIWFQGQCYGMFFVCDFFICFGDYVLLVFENLWVFYYIINLLFNCCFKIGDQEFDYLLVLLEFYKIYYLDIIIFIEFVFRYLSLLMGFVLVFNLFIVEDNLEYVWILYDFFGNDVEDLFFKKGEILVIIEKFEEQWWSVWNKDGWVGMIFVFYVEKFVRFLLYGKYGNRNFNSYGILEFVYVYV